MLTKTIVRIQANIFTAKNFCGNSKLQADIGDHLQKQVLNAWLRCAAKRRRRERGAGAAPAPPREQEQRAEQSMALIAPKNPPMK